MSDQLRNLDQLQDLDARQDEVLEQLEELNARIEVLLKQFSTREHPFVSSPMAVQSVRVMG